MVRPEQFKHDMPAVRPEPFQSHCNTFRQADLNEAAAAADAYACSSAGMIG
jgi:hypothetical protein